MAAKSAREAIAAIAERGVRRFRVRLKATAPVALEGTFQFKPADEAYNGLLGFVWSSETPNLPSMWGRIVARRLGPLTILSIHARHSYDDGPAGRLFHEAIGARLAREIFAHLVTSIRRAVQDSTRRSIPMDRETDAYTKHRRES